MRAKDFARIQPWAVALVVDLSPSLDRGMDPSLGVDRHFVDEAEESANSKRIVGIETEDFK